WMTGFSRAHMGHSRSANSTMATLAPAGGWRAEVSLGWMGCSWARAPRVKEKAAAKTNHLCVAAIFLTVPSPLTRIKVLDAERMTVVIADPDSRGRGWLLRARSSLLSGPPLGRMEGPVGVPA